MAEKSLSRAWLVLAVILILFFVGIFLDRIFAAVIPTYLGVFRHNPFTIETQNVP
ncbi:MAG: hypothetical protein U0517_00510 [Candidatus Andersenbacteria bacterium]